MLYPLALNLWHVSLHFNAFAQKSTDISIVVVTHFYTLSIPVAESDTHLPCHLHVYRTVTMNIKFKCEVEKWSRNIFPLFFSSFCRLQWNLHTINHFQMRWAEWLILYESFYLMDTWREWSKSEQEMILLYLMSSCVLWLNS